jgi:ankyrin repeat protein
VDATEPRTGNTSLHIAARNGDEAMIRALLTKGADYSLKNKTGYLAVHEAAAAGQTKAASYLVERCHRSPGERATLLPRVRIAAEIHGHSQTAEALKALEVSAGISFVDRVSEAPRREAYKISRRC